VGSLPGNSALGFLARAIEAGISSVLLSEALLAVVALRILPAGDGDDPMQAVSEVLFVDTALRRALQDGGDIDRIREAAREQGFLEISARARAMKTISPYTQEDLERHRYLEDAA
jgi:type II secretory ATPase GspE/PulE/Tfp pilus assembly ATPase PilB-like protein